MQISSPISMKQQELVKSQVADYLSLVMPEIDIIDILKNETIVAKDVDMESKYAINMPSINLNPPLPNDNAVGNPPIPDAPNKQPSEKVPNVSGISEQSKAVPSDKKPTDRQENQVPKDDSSNVISKNIEKVSLAITQIESKLAQQDTVLKEFSERFTEIYKFLESYVSKEDMEYVHKTFMDNVQKVTKEINDKFESFKSHTVPERIQFETDLIYKDRVFGKICELLDQMLPDLFDVLPTYELLSISGTQYFRDGAICNALVTINVRVDCDGSQYNFKLDVPIIQGVVNAPIYLERNGKLIALLKSDIDKEFKTDSRMKSYPKPNMISDNRDSIFTPSELLNKPREDNQKQYMTSNPTSGVAVPFATDWQRRILNMNNIGNSRTQTETNNPKYYPKI